MSGLDLKGTLFYTPSEVALLFRRVLRENRVKFITDANGDETPIIVAREGDPDLGWAYKAGKTFLKSAVRRFPKQTLFLRTEVDRIALEGIPVDPPRARRRGKIIRMEP